jgi:hypothetical protein
MAHSDALSPDERTLCGVVQHAQDKRERRRSKPQPWIVLKLAVIVSFAIIAYVSYVYIGRFCVPMLKRKSHALGSLTIGSKSTLAETGLQYSLQVAGCSHISHCVFSASNHGAVVLCEGVYFGSAMIEAP